MSLYMAIFMGGTPIGAPLVGWVANVAGPRWSLAVASAAGLAAAIVGIVWIFRAQQLRLRFDRTARGMRYIRLVPRGTMRQAPAKEDGAAPDSLQDGAA
jgi:MFS family permease